MEEKKVQQVLTEILCDAVNETDNGSALKEKITPETLLSVYLSAKKHDLAHVVSGFVFRNNINLPKELQAGLRNDELMAVYRSGQMQYTLEEICGIFDEAGIAYIPLKGAVLRPYYPSESMRTSCDIDILIHENDLEKALGWLEAKEYRCGERNYHDVSLYSPGNIHLELHFTLQENRKNLDAVLKDAWDYAVRTDGSRYRFSDEFFAFHIFAHMAYHFVSGGCGIRSLLDIWVMEHRMGISHSCAEKLLKKAGIDRFASEMSRLAERCFSGNGKDSFDDPVLRYIFQGGVYGCTENHIAIDKSKAGSSVVYALKRLFMPYRSMVILYPILKKAPYLLPFCWCARGIGVVTGGKSGRILAEMACAGRLSDEKIYEIKEICSRLGL